MTLHDAQSTLDDIRRLQDKTLDELVRQAFALPYMLLMALGLFIGYGSTDLPSPWDDVVLVLGFGLYMAVVIVHTRVRLCRASVRPRSVWVPSPLEAVFYIGWAFSPLLVFLAATAAARALDLPLPGTLAAAVTALTFVATTPLIRGIAKAVMRRDTGRL